MKKVDLVNLAETLQKDLKSKENTLSQLKAGKAELKNEVSFLQTEKTKLDQLIDNVINPFIEDVQEKVDSLPVDQGSGEVIFPQFYQLGKLWATATTLYEIGKCAVKLVISIYKLLIVKPDEQEEPTEGTTL